MGIGADQPEASWASFRRHAAACSVCRVSDGVVVGVCSAGLPLIPPPPEPPAPSEGWAVEVDPKNPRGM